MKKAKRRVFPRHPARIQQESQYRINQKRDEQLLSMYERATTFPLKTEQKK